MIKGENQNWTYLDEAWVEHCRRIWDDLNTNKYSISYIVSCTGKTKNTVKKWFNRDCAPKDAITERKLEKLYGREDMYYDIISIDKILKRNNKMNNIPETMNNIKSSLEDLNQPNIEIECLQLVNKEEKGIHPKDMKPRQLARRLTCMTKDELADFFETLAMFIRQDCNSDTINIMKGVNK